MSKRILDKQAVELSRPNTQSIMLLVMLALLPGTAVYAYYINPLVIFNIIAAIVAALLFEIIASLLRKKPGLQIIQDASIALAAYLLALAVPPTLPLWQLLVGVFIMVMLGKHVYGGLGQNPFNPAMVAYAALLISFPQNMTLWLGAGEWQTAGWSALMQFKLGFGSNVSNTPILWDGITQATPLEHARIKRMQSLDLTNSEAIKPLIESGWPAINMAFLCGGLFLLYKKIIQWHIPVTVIGSFTILSVLFSSSSISIPYSLLAGALILGAFFIATDPVTTASSNRGRLIFGCGVGVLSFVIREYGGYPEGIAFAVLLMNLCVPLIDHIDMRLG